MYHEDEVTFDEIVARAHDVFHAVEVVLGDTSWWSGSFWADPALLDQAIQAAAHTVQKDAEVSSAGPVAQRAAVLNELGELRMSLQAFRLSRQHEAVIGLNQSLRRLRTAVSVAELAERIPQEVVSLGFNRSLFS